MRIGVDIRCLMESRYSGISEYTYNLLQHLIRLDTQNQYVLFYNTAKKVQVPVFDQPNVTIRGFSYPNKLFNLTLRFLKLWSVDQMIGGVDVFLTPNFLFLHLSDSCKKLLIVHDLSFELYPQFFTYKKRLWHTLIGPAAMARQADQIVAISENTKRDLIQQYQIPAEKIQVVYNGVNDLFFIPAPESEKIRVRDKYRLPEQFVLYLGNLEPRKNIDGVIAAALMPGADWTLVVAGGEAWKFKRMYRQSLALLKQDRIKFLGYVDEGDKPALYALASVFVYPSIYEGFGLPPLEAMACGTPVVCSHSSSLPEAVGDAALMVDPYNIAMISQCITQILTTPQLAAELSERGRKRAGQFRWDTVAQTFLEILHALQR